MLKYLTNEDVTASLIPNAAPQGAAFLSLTELLAGPACARLMPLAGDRAGVNALAVTDEIRLLDDLPAGRCVRVSGSILLKGSGEESWLAKCWLAILEPVYAPFTAESIIIFQNQMVDKFCRMLPPLLKE